MFRFTLGIALPLQLQESHQITMEKSNYLDVRCSVQGKSEHSRGNASQQLDHDSGWQKGGLERL